MAWLPKKKILVPIDFSEASLRALEVALELADSPEHVHALHVLPHLSPVEPGVLFGNMTSESRLKKAGESVSAKLAAAGHEDLHSLVRVGSPAKEIVTYAEEIDADLIVIPALANEAAAIFHIGSTSSRVTQMAQRPVLVLKESQD